MGKIAFVFSGQGAQKAGMGHGFYISNRTVGDLFEGAEAIRPDTKRQCFEGTDEELKQTENTQPALYLADLAAAIALKESGIVPEGVAGFSLGEIPALAFAGAYSYMDGFAIATKRGELMGEAAKKFPATMLAVMKLENNQIVEICSNFKAVFPVNYNAPSQLVVAGAKEEMADFAKAVKEAGGRGLPIAVGGGFHSPFMNEAADGFGKVLADFDIQTPQIPVYSNYTTSPYGDDVKTLMTLQMNNSLRWQESIENMVADGFDTFIEVGVGNTLKKLIARIAPEAKAYSVSSVEDIKMLKESL